MANSDEYPEEKIRADYDLMDTIIKYQIRGGIPRIMMEKLDTTIKGANKVEEAVETIVESTGEKLRVHRMS